MAGLLATLPVAGRLMLGNWGFGDAFGLACLCALAGVYFDIVSRRRLKALADPASMLQEAIATAQAGQIEEAIAVLTRAIRLSPKLWQAYQYRGQMHLALGRDDLARDDFEEAIRLAPDEADLYALRDAAIAPKTTIATDEPVPPAADR
jgi:tetratricopeptide (TPR) repeat protein